MTSHASSAQPTRLDHVLARNFGDEEELLVQAHHTSVPLIAANLRKTMKSYSKGQKIYIYDVYWGMNEKMHIVPRYRRKHAFRAGVIPIQNAENFRLEIVYDPRVLQILNGRTIRRQLFPRFLEPERQIGWLRRIALFWRRLIP